jgi:hypothetical protein
MILVMRHTTVLLKGGEVAIQLFLNELFELPSKVDICVERKRIVEVLNVRH